MPVKVDQKVVTKLRAQVEARRFADVVRELAIKIQAAARSAHHARLAYGLSDKEDIPELISARQEVMNWTVRRQVLVECWELATGKVWASGTGDA